MFREAIRRLKEIPVTATTKASKVQILEQLQRAYEDTYNVEELGKQEPRVVFCVTDLGRHNQLLLSVMVNSSLWWRWRAHWVIVVVTLGKMRSLCSSSGNAQHRS